jgi:hypothetical protein
MAKEFDIEKIERAGEENVPKLMTGAYTKELSPKTEVEPNAEIEKGEYIMYPDGTTQKAIGETHANGGMMMNLPDGTRVLSNFLKPSSETKKILKDNFGLKVEKPDTYSKLLDKFLKKIGYEKIVEEQEEAFESLRKLLDKKTIDRNTLAVNREFLSKKIFDIETKKLELEESKKEMFDLLYNEQEDTKSQKETNEDGEYKYGGLKRSKFEEVCRKNGMTVEEGMKMLSAKKYERGGLVPKYQAAGKHSISSGETFYGIANKLGVKAQDLINANPGIDINRIAVGQVLNVPVKDDFTVDMNKLKKGISHVESADGVLMTNPNSSATGLYGQLYNELTSDIYSGTRDQFAKDKSAQNRVFDYRYNTGIGGNSLKQDTKDIIKEYQNQVDLSNYSNEDIVALVNFLGRQGTRKYLGNVVRDKKPLSEVYPHLYGKDVKAKNKTPQEYLDSFRSVTSKMYGGEILNYQDAGPVINPTNASDLLASGEINQEQYVNAMYSFYGEEYNPNNDPQLNPERSMANRISPSSDSFNFNIGYQPNVYSEEAVEFQSAAGEEGGYGNITNAEDALNALYRQFPDIVLDIFGSDVKVEQGKLKLTNKDLKLNKPNPKVGQLQKRMNDRMAASANLLLASKNASEEQKKAAQEYLDKQTFYTGDVTLEGVTEEQKVRSDSDKKLGQFTSGRFLPNVDLLTPEEIKKAKEKGYTTAKQIKSDKEFYDSLSTDSKNRFESIGDLGEADFFITDYEPVVAEEQTEEEFSDEVVVPKPNFPKMFAYPYQYVRPPMGMQATLFPEARLSRIDPLRISPEQTLQAISDSRQFTADQFADLNPMQRASALSQMTGQAMLNEARAIRDTNVMNAQYQTQADLFNIGQRDKEGLLGEQNALGYEARTFSALDKTDKNMRDWELYNNKQALAEYDYNRKLNLLDSIFPDFSPNFLGNRIMFDPSAPFDADARRDFLMFMPSLT